VISPCEYREPIGCTTPASSPSLGGSVTSPGTRIPGNSPASARAIIIAGRPLSQVAMPITARREGSDRMSRPDASLAVPLL
jgi:hypothetical protein